MPPVNAMRSAPGRNGRPAGCGCSSSRPAATPRNRPVASGKRLLPGSAALEADRTGLREERDRLAARPRAAARRRGGAGPARGGRAQPVRGRGGPDQAGPADRAGRAAPRPGHDAARRGVEAGQRGGSGDRLQPGTARRELVRHVRELQSAAPGNQAGARAKKGKLTTGRPGIDHRHVRHRGSGFLAAAVAVLLAVRWWPGWTRCAGRRGRREAAAPVRWWAVRPQRRLPRHRVRHMRLRAGLRLHPGKGHATLFELWLRWGRRAAARRARRAGRPCRFRAPAPPVADVGAGRPAHYHRARAAGPGRGHVIYVAPPRRASRGR